MQRIAATLWPQLQTFQIYGANTNVGKTVVSTVLCKAFRERNRFNVHYLKPVSTGAVDRADDRLVLPSPVVDGAVIC
jgi:dethiobiotin synthetase/adenosylmethionine--8-amino-7-oxononanoate aminotransferase